MTVRCPAFLSYKYLIIYADTAIDRALKGMSACAPSAPLHRREPVSTGTDTSSGRFLMSNKFTGKRHAVNRHSTERTTGHTPPETGTAYVVHLKNTILQRINHIPYALHDRNVARKSMFRHAIKPISHRRKGFLAVRKSPFRITERRLLRSDMYNTLTLKSLSNLSKISVYGGKSLSVCKWRSLMKAGVMIFYHLGNAVSPHRAAGKRRSVHAPSRQPCVPVTAVSVLRNAPSPTLPPSRQDVTM